MPVFKPLNLNLAVEVEFKKAPSKLKILILSKENKKGVFFYNSS